ncbi:MULTISPECIES: AAA family ATPase [unclassified Microcoleus]|uniref:AAA family ATPase n=1 Tax=unclassified Microcoleus TaxID=2642155 RepID=UPI002FD2FE6A
MIGEVRIENYKSIQKLKLELGRVTVLIGENGCGKSNILEAIALASAAADDKLDNEFLASRGIRVTEPQFMRSAFERKNLVKNIKIDIKENQGENFSYLLHNDNSPYSKWENKDLFAQEIYLKDIVYYSKARQNVISTNPKNQPEEVSLEDVKKSIKALEGASEDELEQMLKPKTIQEFLLLLLGSINRSLAPAHLIDFTIYSPEDQALRTFEKEGQIQPLGINGEGLFKLIKFLNSDENQDRLNQIQEKLRLIDWFRDFEVPEDLSPMQTSLQIKDKYLDIDLSYFDQRSSNEGFLFVLFYLALFISDLTPSFFAIDNIDASLNPRLCRRLMQELVELAKKHDKQVIFTTHNPAVLDGLDLDDDEQRLLVISRNQLGYTKARRILKPKPLEGQEPVKLSEAFLRGYIGGLPKNF